MLSAFTVQSGYKGPSKLSDWQKEVVEELVKLLAGCRKMDERGQRSESLEPGNFWRIAQR
jgi:hypothetical protein